MQHSTESANQSSSRVSLITSTVSWTALPANLEEKILDITGLIHQKANALRSQQPVNWLPYLDSGLISQTDYSFITMYQQAKTKEDRDELLTIYEESAFRSLVNVVKRVCIVEEIQKFLVLIDDMLMEDISRINRLYCDKAATWKAFLDLLSCADDFVRNIASRIISKFLTSKCCKPGKYDIEFYCNWLKDELRNDNNYLLSVARCLQRLLRVDEYRLIFLHINGIFKIIRLLSIGMKPQAQYQLVFCLWVSSFNPRIAKMLNKFSAIPVLIEMLQSAPFEVIKLQRIILATVRNLLVNPHEEEVRKHNALLLIECKALNCLEILKHRQRTISDPEFLDDLEVIEDILTKYVAELSTYDEYKMEVKSGRLEWSVVHTSKVFWKENASRLNDSEYELLKILVSLLEESKDTISLCVASHDLGEYMSNYSRGKKVVEELGGKESLLRLLSHENPVVKYHALKSLQILMLNNYDLLIEHVSDKRTLNAVEEWKIREHNDNA